ncbi:MAG: SDR family oxidoreductase [Phycisphaeraceae bacterium]|nr:SDR family oxidoreductase [Phycisphaeraceae bacterium]
MKIDLTGKVALVTGATSELGRVIARTLGQCGALIVIHYHQAADKAQALHKELPGSYIVQADVTQEADVLRMRDEVKSQLAAPDIIVNNAVIQYPRLEVLKQSTADYISQFESCVLHNVLMSQAFVPDMIAKKWGRVIAMNSESSMQNWSTQSAYVSGKRGMDGVLRCLAREIGEHNITVNQVAPGWTVSETRPEEGRPQWYRNGIALKRYGKDQDIANAVAFLASDLASYITGTYLPVCGGNIMPAI